MPTQAKEFFEAQSKSLGELLSGNGLGLYLPPYQRAYSWERGKVEKLLDDTLHGLKNLSESSDGFTFLGTVITIHDTKNVTVHPIVKSQVPSKVLTVIDGQQRLSTLLLLLVCLHNLIRQQSWKVFKGNVPDPSDAARFAMFEETSNILGWLGVAFYEKQNTSSDAPIYPRLIRAFKDQWSKNAKEKQYESPIAHLIYTYSVTADAESPSDKPVDFKPRARPGVGDGENDLIRRFGEIRNALTKLAQQKTVEELEDFPSLSILGGQVEFQRALFNHELDPDLCTWLSQLDGEPEAVLMRLGMFGAYVLHRIALTVVQGKDEDYAFTIFESLNTTGEPLTAFETFVPRVVGAESIEDYQGSDAHSYIRAVEKYLDRFGVGDKLQNATRDLLVTFALAETGKKLSKRLSDQRVYMTGTFDRHKTSADQRNAYLRHLRDTAGFVGATWDPSKNVPRQLSGLPDVAMTDTVKLCLSFLADLNHTIAIAPLVRFYSNALAAEPGAEQAIRVKEFETAIKAITAFTVFWRSTRTGTGNIDSQYRSVMAGENKLTGMGPLARLWNDPRKDDPKPVVDAEALKKELAARLSSVDQKYGGVPNLKSFLAAASVLPFYSISTPLTKFLLLAGYHDTIADPNTPGFIKAGKPGVAPCFTSQGWSDAADLTIEHIAPRQYTSGWDQSFYSDKNLVNRLGNLVLAPGPENSSLGARPWKAKRVLYAALGASSVDEAKTILLDSGQTFALSTEDLAKMSRHLPHLTALGQREDEWDPGFIAERGEVLLRLVYARLKDWLGLEWSEDTAGEVVSYIENDVDSDEDMDTVDDVVVE